MNINLKLNPRRLLLVAAVGLVAAATAGFAAANSVPGSAAGDGSGAISGYTVSNIHYALNSATPNLTTTVTFDINPPLTATSSKRVSLDGGTNWLAANACTGTTTVTCTAAVSVLSLTNLRVVASD